jgi:putative transferase (TIGR04331 family)
MDKVLFLATTALEEFWDEGADEIIFLTEGAKLYSCRHYWENLDFVDAPYIWSSSAYKAEAFEECQHVYDFFLSLVAEELNSYHKVDKDKEYYRVLLGEWLFRFIQILYDRYFSLETAFSKYPDLTTYLLDPKQEYIPDSGEDFFDRVKTDEYNIQLYSQILRIKENSFPIRRLSRVLKSTRVIHNDSNSLRSFLKWAISRLMLKFSARPYTLLCNAYFGKSSLMKILKLFFSSRRQIVLNDMEGKIVLPKEIDYEYRIKDILKNSYCSPFEKVVSKLVFCNLPIVYLEGYSSLLKSVRRQKVNPPPLCIYTANALQNNIILKAYIAEYRKSLYISCHQHGGGYGIDQVASGEYYERSIVDHFYTWGWEDGPASSYLPPPRDNIRWRPNHNKPYILLVMTALPRYVDVLKANTSSNDFLYQYINLTKRFIASLSIPFTLKVRFNKDDLGWSVEERLGELNGIVWEKDNHSKVFLEVLQHCELFVVDHFMTTALESLGNEVPTVVFFNPKMYLFKEEAKKLIHKLRLVGIVHDTPESAARHISSISSNINAWWLREDVVAARVKFVKKYAKFDKDWVKYWADQISPIERNL